MPPRRLLQHRIHAQWRYAHVRASRVDPLQQAVLGRRIHLDSEIGRELQFVEGILTRVGDGIAVQDAPSLGIGRDQHLAERRLHEGGVIGERGAQSGS